MATEALLCELPPISPSTKAEIQAENALLKEQLARVQEELAQLKKRNPLQSTAAVCAHASRGAKPARGRKAKKEEEQSVEDWEPKHGAEGEDSEEYGGSEQAESESESEEERPAKRGRASSGTGGRQSAAERAAAKEALKGARQHSMQFKKDAGARLSSGMAWQRRGCDFSFSCTIDPNAFEYTFNDIGEQYDATSRKRGQDVRMLKLDTQDCMTVFGKGRTIKKYRLGSVGQIHSMDVTYDQRRHSVTRSVRWGVDGVLGASKYSF